MVAAGVFVTPQLGDTVLADPDLAPLASLPDGVQSPADLRYLTRVNLSRGVDVVKTRANPRAGLPEQDPLELVYDEEQLSAVVDTARRGGAGVLCHAYSAEGCDGAVRSIQRIQLHARERERCERRAVVVWEALQQALERARGFVGPTRGARGVRPLKQSRGIGRVVRARGLRR